MHVLRNAPASEAASLLLDECEPPDEGWVMLESSEVSSAVERDWTDDGEVHEASKLKGGPRNAIRRVPIPPVLVTMIREHVDPFGTAPDGRQFRTYKDGIYLPSTLWTVLQKARKVAFTEGQQASLLAHKPYDFRHGGVSWRLNAGTPATLVVDWAGHTVEVLLRIYGTASAATTSAGSARWRTHSAWADLARYRPSFLGSRSGEPV